MSNIENTSGLKPLGRAVLVRSYQPERKDSLIQLPDFVEERGSAIEVRAIVIEVGEGAWPDEPARAKPGDHVFITKMAGFAARGTADGQSYRFINDRDIFAKITKES